MWVFAAVLPMLVASELLRNRDVIFPEAAALTFGVLALRLPEWSLSPARLALLPPACASIGVALVGLDTPRWAGELIALSLAFIILHVARSRLTPSISAAVFPLVFGVHSWTYPITVMVISTGLAGVIMVRRRHGQGPRPATRDRLPRRSALTAWAIAATWIVIAGPALRLGAGAVAPPLIVAMVEWIAGSDRSAATGLRHWSVLVAAAGVGALAVQHITPAWVGGLIATGIVLTLFATFSGPHPPALAICLIPQVARGPGVNPLHFVAALAIGAAVLYVGASVVHRDRGELFIPEHGSPSA